MLQQSKSMKRALRRHHKFRMTRKAKRSRFVVRFPPAERWSVARKVADHLKVCSCEYSCGNPRHNRWSSHRVALTKQERLSDFSFRELMLDWDWVLEDSAMDHIETDRSDEQQVD